MEKGESSESSTHLSADKILVIFFFGAKGISCIDFFHKRRTVNATYHCQIINEQKLVYRRKKPDFHIRNVCFFCTINTRLFIAIFNQKKLVKIGWILLEHYFYCLNFFQCRYNTLKEDNALTILMLGRKWL